MSTRNIAPNRFVRLGAWAYRRRVAALAAWVAILVGVTALAQAVGADWRNDFSLPGTESQQVTDLLGAHAPDRRGENVQIVVQARDGVGSQPVRERVGAMLEQVEGLPGVAAVDDPYEARTISEDGTVALANVTVTETAGNVDVDDTRRIVDTARAAEGDGLRVEVGGDPVREAEEGEGSGGAEGAGMLAALVVLVMLFGSLLAAAMPLVIAIFAVGSAIGLVTIASHVATVADFTPPVMMLVGLGVGIDYALLVFSRFRGELLAGADRETATRTALDTAGRTIFFAGFTVIIALLGLVLLGLGSLQGVAVAVALTVLATMGAALTLLPALLGLFGPRLERRLRRRAERRGETGEEGARWRRWSERVQRRPAPFAVAGVVLLLALSLPATGMRLGFADAGSDSPSSTTRQAYDLLADAFGPGFAGPLIVVSEGSAAGDAALARALEQTDGIARVVPPVRSGDGAISTAIAFPETRPDADATHELVGRLRDDVLPRVEAEAGGPVHVGGSTAAAIDYADEVSGKLPLFVGAVVGLSALLLMAVFRSLLIPLKAAAFNLLSVGASMGIITLAFQEGVFGGETGPIEAFVPVMIFAIVFGLSMDYEVFLLSRMHESWERHRDARRAIGEGLATTGRVVTAAATIMVVVFGAFLLSPSRMLREFGLGLASAILLDAVVVRSLLVPAVMQMLGRRAWWLPSPIARRLPRLALERASDPA
jgi:RND superfamily putative drug exporter